ncbi:MAG: hypothetical protein RJA81_2273 [Planctomycetota bacterium]
MKNRRIIVIATLGISCLMSLSLILTAQEPAVEKSADLPTVFSPESADKTVIEETLRTVKARNTGTGSCSAVACHGGVGRKSCEDSAMGIWRSEYTVWMTDDRHSRAYEVLHQPLATKIAENLAAGSEVIPAWKDLRCLACHSTPRSKREFEATVQLNADGVGCESCHGPAQNWLTEHTTNRWQSIDSETRQRDYQFTNTKNLEIRTRMCVGCHLGRRDDGDLVDRDMNHDMIAAGHPRLNFEMSAYSDLMPKHWCENREESPSPNADQNENDQLRPLRLWLTGVKVMAEEGLALSASRCGDENVPWPEFSELNCQKCHHDLTADMPRLRDARQESLNWGSWFLGPWVNPELEPLFPNKQAIEKTKPLRDLMNGPWPDRQKFLLLIKPLLTEEKMASGPVASGLPADRERIEKVLDTLLKTPFDSFGKDWEAESQAYLLLFSLYQSGFDEGRRELLRQRLDLIRQRLSKEPLE